jgi:putative membrane protein
VSAAAHVEVLIGAAVLAAAYALAWRSSGRRPSPARGLAFAAALSSLLVALNGPVHDLAEAGRFSAHMAQHLILTLVLPPLLLAGTPSFMADALLDPWLTRPLAGPLLRALTRPLPALAAWSVALVAWHLPGPYAAARDSHGLHFVQHATLVAAATLAWWPVLSPSRRLPAPPYAARILYLFAFGMPMTVVAAMIAAAEQALYPPVTLDDQRLGGLLMWVPAAVVPLVVFTAVFVRWTATESESEDRVEATAFPE